MIFIEPALTSWKTHNGFWLTKMEFDPASPGVKHPDFSSEDRFGKSPALLFVPFSICDFLRAPVFCYTTIPRRIRVSNRSLFVGMTVSYQWFPQPISPKCTKHTNIGPLLEVETLKNCTPLWREADFEVKMHKTLFSDHFCKLRCRKSARIWMRRTFHHSRTTSGLITL